MIISSKTVEVWLFNKEKLVESKHTMNDPFVHDSAWIWTDLCICATLWILSCVTLLHWYSIHMQAQAPPGWLSGELVWLMTWRLRVRSPIERLFFPVYFRLSLLQKHMRKVVGDFGKKSRVSTGVRKPGSTYASPTAMIWPLLLKWR